MRTHVFADDRWPTVLPAVVAWLVVATLSPWLNEILPPRRFEPRLPDVSAPFRPHSEIVSVVPGLFSALAIALAVGCLVEITKFLVFRRVRVAASLHAAFTMFQILLLIDLLRMHALDWYWYALHFARLVELTSGPLPRNVPPIPAPWLSFAGLLLAVAATLRSSPRSRAVLPSS